MLDSFLTFINQQGWDLKRAPTILTVSGGIDSIVLLQLFHKAGFPAVIAHCNFQLRGEESDADEDFVRALGNGYGYPVYVKRFDTNTYKISAGVSTQMAARTLRYAWFSELRLALHAPFVATAHHAGDFVETVLLNQVRGTGLSGLNGIRVENDHFIRPLLFTIREEIEGFAQRENLQWREDRSSASDLYLRNRLRHHVIPVLKGMNPSLEQTFLKNAARIAAADRLLSSQLREWTGRWVSKNDGELAIDLAALNAHPEPAYVLWYVLQDRGFAYEQAVQVSTMMKGLSGKMYASASHELLVDRTHLLVRPRSSRENREVLGITAPGSYRIGDKTLHLALIESTGEFSRSTEDAWFDADRIEFPLQVRKWALGDRVQPFGMKGKSKLVSDILTDVKLSVFAKERAQVLTDATGLILWVIGHRASHQAAVNMHTTKVLHAFVTVE